jgi:hypothetical protein
VDNKELVPGTPIWEAEIEKAIRGASAVLALLSPDSKKSRWVLSEIAFAEQYHKRIFPVLVRGGKKASIPLRLINNQYVDIRENEEVGLTALLTELTRFLEERGVEETDEQAPEIADKEEAEETKKVKAEVTSLTKWKIEIVIAVITLLGAILSSPILNIIFPTRAPTPSSISNPANMLAPAPSSTFAPTLAIIPSVTFTPTPVCRPPDNQPPGINLNFVPRSVKVNLTAKLTISVSDSENDAYEIILITAEKGHFPNGKEEPYLYEAPGLPGKDIITVWVADHQCTTKEEITITIIQ